MMDKMEFITRNDTRTLVDRPPRYKSIAMKWIYKIKCGSKEFAICYKTCLVARGDLEQPSIDYQDTFAQVVKWGSMHNVISLATQKGWTIHVMNMKTAFLIESSTSLYI